MKKRKVILGSLIAILLLFFLYQQIDFSKLKDFKIEFNYYWFLAALFLIIFSNLIRAGRFNLLLNNQFRLFDIFRITYFYNLYNEMFPGGLGELSFVYLIKKRIKEHIPLGLSSIILTRIYDVLIIAIFLLASLLVIGDVDTSRGKLAVLAGLIIITAFLIINYLNKIIEKLLKVLAFLAKDRFLFLEKIKDNLHLTTDFLKEKRSETFKLFFLSFFFWFLRFWVTYMVYRSIGLQFSYFETVLLGSLFALMVFIPINTFLGFGYKEAGVAFGLVLLSVPKDEAIIYSFWQHIVSIALLLIGVFFAWLLGSFKNKFLNKEEYES